MAKKALVNYLVKLVKRGVYSEEKIPEDIREEVMTRANKEMKENYIKSE